MKIRREITVEIEPSPEELADAFWSLNQHEQARFFNGLFGPSSWRLPFQLQAVSDSNILTPQGRYAMRLIGEYAEKL